MAVAQAWKPFRGTNHVVAHLNGTLETRLGRNSELATRELATEYSTRAREYKWRRPKGDSL